MLKTFRPLIFLSIFLGAAAPTLFAQKKTQDVVYKKDGSILRGDIIEVKPNESFKVQTADGSIWVIPASEVEKTVRETVKSATTDRPDLPVYKFTAGFGFGGGGLIGIPVRYYVKPEFALEIGGFLRPLILKTGPADDAFEIKGKMLLAGGFDAFLTKKYKERKGKWKKNGIFMKGGGTFGDFSESFFALGWANEGIRKESLRQSFTSELGLGLLKTSYDANPYDNAFNGTTPLLYWKFNWNWAIK